MPNYESTAPAAPEPVKKPKPRVKPVVEKSERSTSIQIDPKPAVFISKYRQHPQAKLRTRPRRLKSVTLPTLSPVIAQTEVNMEIKRIVEAILFAASHPMTAKQIQQVFPEIEQPELAEIQSAIDSITEEYQLRPVELKKIASGFRFQVKAELSRWVSRLFEEKPPKYSRALLETLAIIAYRQPVTRGEIEDIRGVSVSSSIMQTLMERDWIRVIAHKEVPGRPGLYGTTKEFLDYFNISSVTELPTLQEIQALDLSIADTQQPMQVESERQETTVQDPSQPASAEIGTETSKDCEAIPATID